MEKQFGRPVQKGQETNSRDRLTKIECESDYGSERKDSGTTHIFFWLDQRPRKRIHKLAHDYGIDQEEWFKEGGFAAKCGLCKELASANGNSADLKQDAGTAPGQK